MTDITSIVANDIDGIVLLDKPYGMSSANAVQHVKRLFNVRKAGHSGSLDPLATGLLPICLGQATKFSAYLLDADKRYQAIAKLGVTTTTADNEGDVVTTRPVPAFSTTQLTQLTAAFTGQITQVPSMFSALKHQGTPLYKLARQGIQVARKPRQITIKSLVIDDYCADELHITVHCGKGTYIRNLVEDMGEALGCGAHVSQLRRIGVGDYQIADMVELSTLQASQFYQCVEYVHPVASFGSYPRVELAQDVASALLCGRTTSLTSDQLVGLGSPSPGLLRAFTDKMGFIGIVTLDQDGGLAAKRMMSSG